MYIPLYCIYTLKNRFLNMLRWSLWSGHDEPYHKTRLAVYVSSRQDHTNDLIIIMKMAHYPLNFSVICILPFTRLSSQETPITERYASWVCEKQLILLGGIIQSLSGTLAISMELKTFHLSNLSNSNAVWCLLWCILILVIYRGVRTKC